MASSDKGLVLLSIDAMFASLVQRNLGYKGFVANEQKFEKFG